MTASFMNGMSMVPSECERNTHKALTGLAGVALSRAAGARNQGRSMLTEAIDPRRDLQRRSTPARTLKRC